MAWSDLPSVISSDWSTGWGAMVFVASFAIFMGYTLIYVLSRAIQSDDLQRAALSEMFQALFSILLAAMIVEVLTLTFSYMVSSVGGGSYITCDAYGKITLTGAGPIEAIRCRLDEKASLLSDLYEKMYYAAREPFNEFTRNWGIIGIPMYYQGAYIWQSSPSQLYYEVEAYRMLNSIITTLLIGINAYLAAVDYVKNSMLTMFLPIGIVLRAIPFTRGVGAFFMSLAIGLYIIYPFIFFITDPTFIRAPMPYMDITKADLTWPWPSFKGAISVAMLGPQTDASSAAFSSANIEQAASDLTRLYYFFIIHPLLVLSITLVIMRYMMYLFGAEGYELARLATKIV